MSQLSSIAAWSTVLRRVLRLLPNSLGRSSVINQACLMSMGKGSIVQVPVLGNCITLILFSKLYLPCAPIRALFMSLKPCLHISCVASLYNQVYSWVTGIVFLSWEFYNLHGLLCYLCAQSLWQHKRIAHLKTDHPFYLSIWNTFCKLYQPVLVMKQDKIGAGLHCWQEYSLNI